MLYNKYGKLLESTEDIITDIKRIRSQIVKHYVFPLTDNFLTSYEDVIQSYRLTLNGDIAITLYSKSDKDFSGMTGYLTDFSHFEEGSEVTTIILSIADTVKNDLNLIISGKYDEISTTSQSKILMYGGYNLFYSIEMKVLKGDENLTNIFKRENEAVKILPVLNAHNDYIDICFYTYND